MSLLNGISWNVADHSVIALSDSFTDHNCTSLGATHRSEPLPLTMQKPVSLLDLRTLSTLDFCRSGDNKWDLPSNLDITPLRHARAKGEVNCLKLDYEFLLVQSTMLSCLPSAACGGVSMYVLPSARPRMNVLFSCIISVFLIKTLARPGPAPLQIASPYFSLSLSSD